MKPSSIRSLLLVSALFTPWLQAQDAPAKIREIEQKVLLKQRQEAVSALIGSARETASPEIIGKRVQWLTLVNNRIEEDGTMTAANREEMVRSASTLNDLAWSMITSPDAGARNPEIALKLAALALELGGGNENLKPKVLDTRARALFMLGKHDEAVAEQEKAVEAATIADEKSGMEAALAAYRRNELPPVSSPVIGTAEASAGVEYIMGKLRRIIIPSIEFKDATLEEVVDVLRKQSIALDTMELDPSRKGLNFVVLRPVAQPKPVPGPSGENLPDTIAEPDTLRVKELHLRNVPLAVALKYICDATRSRFKVDDFAVTLVPRNMPEDLFTRTFRVPADFAARLDSGSGANPAPGGLAARRPIIEVLKSAGIGFGEGSSATLTASDTLLVINRPSELDKLEQLIQAVTVPERGVR